MNLHEYVPLAMRTAKIMEPSEMLKHGVLGCMTEAAEFSEWLITTPLDTPAAVKELGDGVWFLVYTANAAGVVLSDVAGFTSYVRAEKPTQIQLDGAALRYSANMGVLGTAVKAAAYYGKSLDLPGFVRALAAAEGSIQCLASMLNIPFETVLSENVAKLRLRYPDAYSDAAAIARADEGAGLAAPVIHDVLMERAEREGITRAEAKLRNYATTTPTSSKAEYVPTAEDIAKIADTGSEADQRYFQRGVALALREPRIDTAPGQVWPWPVSKEDKKPGA